MSIKLIFCGDYLPFDAVDRYCEEEQLASIFGDLLSNLNDVDIAAINLESPITLSNAPIVKTGPLLKSSPNVLLPLKYAGFNLACLSNNHIRNFAGKGIDDTIKLLRDNNIEYVGVGVNIEKARIPFIYNKDGIGIAILNFSENEFNIASEDKAGANPLDIINNVRDIKEAKEKSDYVIVVVHAGQDFNHYPPTFLREQLRFYADEGADAIVCHHSHFIAGYELYKKVPIFYGLGNIIYTKNIDIERNKTIVVQLEIDEMGLHAVPLLYYFDPYSLRLMDINIHPEFDFSEQFNLLNSRLLDNKINEEYWFMELNKEEMYRYIILISGLPNFIFRVLKRFNILHFLDVFFPLLKRSLFIKWNLIRRETHREALLKIFNKMNNGG